MYRTLLLLIFLAGMFTNVNAQLPVAKFGDGIQLLGKDSSFYMKAGFRFQTLYTGEWRKNEGASGFDNVNHSFLIRRARFKFSGWAVSPKLEYKFELALTNRDQSGGIDPEFRGAPNTVLDASVEYKFTKGFSILFGQRKLPGNRERVISSGDLQLVDRSLLNSRYNIDRDVGIQFKTKHFLGGNFLVKEVLAITQGEGRNVTQGNFGGLCYTGRAELYPLGDFAKKGEYTGGATTREEKPKLAVGVTYEINKNAVRERGHLGSFLQGEDGTYYGRDMKAFFIDAMLKYQGFSFMGEYAYKSVSDDDPFVYDSNNTLIGRYFTGNGINLVAGYNLPSNYEITVRYTTINPMEGVARDEREYTFGLSKYVVKHKLKVQSDVIFRNTVGSNDKIFWRFQTDVHF